MRTLTFLACLVLATSGCDSSGDSLTDLSGNWISMNSAQFCQDADLDLSLRVNAAGDVEGTGTVKRWSGQCIGPPNQSITTYFVTVTGTASETRMDLEFQRTGVTSSTRGRLVVDLTPCWPDVAMMCPAVMTGGLGEDDDVSVFRSTSGS